MKKIIVKLSAFLTAVMLSVSLTGFEVFASVDAVTNYSGWVNSGNGWKYMYKGEYLVKDTKINDVLCTFSADGCYLGGKTGWADEKGKKRYYSEGEPFTGWVTDNDGTMKYCLDGYYVRGKFPIGDEAYSFDSKGAYKYESSKLDIFAICGDVPTDSKKISLTVMQGNNNGDYFISDPDKLERWENGKWVDCIGRAIKYETDDIAVEISVQDDNGSVRNGTSVVFYPTRYVGGSLTEGYYRLSMKGFDNSADNREFYDVYAIFKAVPPVEAKMSEELYTGDASKNITVSMLVKINSQREEYKMDKISNKIAIDIERKTEKGWQLCEDFGYSYGGSVKDDSEIEIFCFMPFKVGYYRATAYLGNRKYIKTFRVESYPIETWLDEYSLNSGDITVSFSLFNRNANPVVFGKDPAKLYKKENGEWVRVQAAADIRSTGKKDTVNQYQRAAIDFHLSDYYDVSKLEAGDYAVRIEGIGLAEFKLTDSAPSVKDMPFINLKTEDIKEIQLIRGYAYTIETAVIRSGSGNIEVSESTDSDGFTKIKAIAASNEYLEKTAEHLKQFKFNGVCKNNEDYAGGSFEVVIRYKNNTKKTLRFEDNTEVVYNGKTKYNCDTYAYSELNDYATEIIYDDREGHSYRNYG